MASKNKLLGSGKVEEVEEVVKPKVELKHAPAWYFHINCPEGVIAKTDEEVDALIANGWKDHPGKVRLLPGHEKVFEEEQRIQKDVSKFDTSGKAKKE
jgi:hypothetical protein